MSANKAHWSLFTDEMMEELGKLQNDFPAAKTLIEDTIKNYTFATAAEKDRKTAWYILGQSRSFTELYSRIFNFKSALEIGHVGDIRMRTKRRR
jgi:hypothetical protein